MEISNELKSRLSKLAMASATPSPLGLPPPPPPSTTPKGANSPATVYLKGADTRESPRRLLPDEPSSNDAGVDEEGESGVARSVMAMT